MKTIFTTFALFLALCAAAGATARAGSAVPAPAADTVMLSEATDGDYIVRRFLVKRQGDTDYSIRYQINLASLSAALDGNSRELDGLNAFVDNLMRDTLMHVKSVEITGYSSPDGPRAFNETLARNRARDFKSYVDKKYGFSKKYDVTLNSVAEDWEMCRALVARSSVPDKQAVLDIISGRREPSALLPMQLPADMKTVEQQHEDVPKDMVCYTDSEGNTYDFAFGLDWKGVIRDARVEKYK